MYTTYAVNAGQTKMQVMAFLEDGSKAAGIGIGPGGFPGAETAWAGGSSYSARTPVSKGDALGIVLSNTGSNVNQPVQELYSAGGSTEMDLVNYSGSELKMFFNNALSITGTGTNLKT
jgi:hypothetical protein